MLFDAGEVVERVVSVESDHGSEERAGGSGGEVVEVFVGGDGTKRPVCPRFPPAFPTCAATLVFGPVQGKVSPYSCQQLGRPYLEHSRGGSAREGRAPAQHPG